MGLAGWRTEAQEGRKETGSILAYGLLQVSRVLVACFHFSCWTMVFLPQTWGYGVAWAL